MRILGIDPGTVVVGFGCVEQAGAAGPSAPPALPPMALRVGNLVRPGGGGGPVRLVEAGALRLPRRAPLSERLHELAAGMRALLERLAPAEVALEEAFFGKSVQSALRIGEARGVVLAEAARRGVPVFQFAPARVKRVVAGNGAAGKEAIARMAAQWLGLARPPMPRDVTDALAVALCRAEARRSFSSLVPCSPPGGNV
jgi:crossover junction endodeoxyribonuclease RuvC